MAEVVEQRVLNAPAEQVANLLVSPGEWLEKAGIEAGRGGQEVDARLRAELGRRPVRVRLKKRVQMKVGEMQRLRDKIVVPVTWESAGFSGLFPVMDALFELHPIDNGRTRVAFWGRYDPPLGRAGDLIDQFIAHRVAESTVQSLLDALEARLADLSKEA